MGGEVFDFSLGYSWRTERSETRSRDGEGEGGGGICGESKVTLIRNRSIGHQRARGRPTPAWTACWPTILLLLSDGASASSPRLAPAVGPAHAAAFLSDAPSSAVQS